ncbi:MAG: tRNA (guanosine(46)-N7)-methyltransferase TrmB [Verrucomicrobiales bacterium]|nr:tRNA (guanosine(46)-N7)-methyltransferase TrmB [Verrucomicrobiales bacterium]
MSAEKFEPFALELYPEDLCRRLEQEQLFGEVPAVLEIDLGCGGGRFLQTMAEHFPDRNYIGVERLLGRVRKVCRRCERAGLQNVRALRLETTYAVEWLLPRSCADRVHLLFPDPWPKKKHHKRRLMCQPVFLKSVADLLKGGGEFLFKTDHEEYFELAQEAAQLCPHFEVVPWSEQDFFYAETDFERQWKEVGRKIQGLRLRKVKL